MWNEARDAITESSLESSIFIGCDSLRFKKNGKWKARYTTVVVIHKDSCHGGAIFYNSQTLDDYGNLRQRLITEVGYAIETFDAISDVLNDRYIEIHLDLNGNPMHKSNIVVKEALGWVRGVTGFDAHIKPNSWAATHAADHMVRTGN